MANVPLPPCPQCGGELDLEMRLTATKGLLGGSGLKVPIRESMWVFCTNEACPFEEEGRGG